MLNTYSDSDSDVSGVPCALAALLQDTLSLKTILIACNLISAVHLLYQFSVYMFVALYWV